MPVLRAARGGGVPTPRCGDSLVGVPLYVLCELMHTLMCVSRNVSKLGRLREGSSRWQTGHSSSSAIGGGGGSARFCAADDDDDDEGPTSIMER